MSLTVMRLDHRDDGPDEFFSGRVPVKGVPGGYRRAAAWIRLIRSPASPEELAAEDQVAAAFMDASGSLWTRQSQLVTPSNRLTALFFSFLNREGRHIRRPSQPEVEVQHR